MPFGTKTVEKNSSRDSLKAALGRQPLVAAVDLGASKVSCFIMKPEGVRRADRTLTAAGVGYVQSRGIRGGAIVNLDEASDAIAQAVERAENVAGVNVQGVTVAMAGGQLKSHRISGRVSLGARPISDHDLVRAIHAALAQAHAFAVFEIDRGNYQHFPVQFVKFSSSCSPARALFSGWNCTAKILSRATAAARSTP